MKLLLWVPGWRCCCDGSGEGEGEGAAVFGELGDMGDTGDTGSVVRMDGVVSILVLGLSRPGLGIGAGAGAPAAGLAPFVGVGSSIDTPLVNPTKAFTPAKYSHSPLVGCLNPNPLINPSSLIWCVIRAIAMASRVVVHVGAR